MSTHEIPGKACRAQRSYLTFYDGEVWKKSIDLESLDKDRCLSIEVRHRNNHSNNHSNPIAILDEASIPSSPSHISISKTHESTTDIAKQFDDIGNMGSGNNANDADDNEAGSNDHERFPKSMKVNSLNTLSSFRPHSPPISREKRAVDDADFSPMNFSFTRRRSSSNNNTNAYKILNKNTIDLSDFNDFNEFNNSNNGEGYDHSPFTFFSRHANLNHSTNDCSDFNDFNEFNNSNNGQQEGNDHSPFMFFPHHENLNNIRQRNNTLDIRANNNNHHSRNDNVTCNRRFRNNNNESANVLRVLNTEELGFVNRYSDIDYSLVSAKKVISQIDLRPSCQSPTFV